MVYGFIDMSDARDRVAELHIKRLTIISARLMTAQTTTWGIKKNEATT
jgi:hypothetical protein